MAGMTEQTSAAGVPDSRNEDGDPLETWESIDRADEREQDMIMPTVGGTIRCGEGGHTDRAEQVQAHFRQAADRGLEASTDEHRTRAGRRSTKTSGSETRIPGDPQGDRRGHADAHRQLLDEASKGRWSVLVCIATRCSSAARQSRSAGYAASFVLSTIVASCTRTLSRMHRRSASSRTRRISARPTCRRGYSHCGRMTMHRSYSPCAHQMGYISR